jgi:hypothetical protein
LPPAKGNEISTSTSTSTEIDVFAAPKKQEHVKYSRIPALAQTPTQSNAVRTPANPFIAPSDEWDYPEIPALELTPAESNDGEAAKSTSTALAKPRSKFDELTECLESDETVSELISTDSVTPEIPTATNGSASNTDNNLARLLSRQRLALQYGAPIVGMTVAGPLVGIFNTSMSGRIAAALLNHFSRLRLRNTTARDLHRVLRAAGLGQASGQVGSLFTVLGLGAVFGEFGYPYPTLSYDTTSLPPSILPFLSFPPCPHVLQSPTWQYHEII